MLRIVLELFWMTLLSVSLCSLYSALELETLKVIDRKNLLVPKLKAHLYLRSCNDASKAIYHVSFLAISKYSFTN